MPAELFRSMERVLKGTRFFRSSGLCEEWRHKHSRDFFSTKFHTLPIEASPFLRISMALERVFLQDEKINNKLRVFFSCWINFYALCWSIMVWDMRIKVTYIVT